MKHFTVVALPPIAPFYLLCYNDSCTKNIRKGGGCPMYTLLIADDEADERILIRFLLNRFKDVFHILEAQNGREALELLSGRHVDVLLSDIQMPFLNGIDLVSRVKEVNPDVEVLFFSGYDDFAYVKAALSLKAVNYILKPVDPDEFHKVLTEIVGRLDSHKLQFSRSEQYMETDFHDIIREMPDKKAESASIDDATNLILQNIESALKMKQPEALSAHVHALVDQYADIPKLSHIYIRHICTTLLKMLMDALPLHSEEDLQNAIKEIYSFRHFSDIVKLIEHYLSLVTAEFEQGQNASNYAVYQVEQYIRTHYSEDLTLNILADLVYLNPNYLSNVFSQVTGCTLNKYINQIRMEKAQELLLHTNMKITDISQAVGYPNASYFCKSFQKRFGTTPERFRQGG
ncbi:MAG: response regulator [Lachnospiraceae bacterium]|nr:response regulator [Lachnospiraceae bacterium]